MYPTLFDLAIFGYIAATGLSLAYLVQREEWLHRLASVATIAGWVLHAVALLALAFRLGRPPLGSLSEAMSVAVWVAVLWALWVERQYGVKVLGAFVLPVVLVFSLNSATTRPLAIPGIERALGGAWIWVHIGLVLLGIAAFVLNFAGALMYVLQERIHQGPGEVQDECRDAEQDQPDVHPDPCAAERALDAGNSERSRRRRVDAKHEDDGQDERAQNLDAVLTLHPESPQHRNPHRHRHGLAQAAERRPAQPKGEGEKRHSVEDPAGDRRYGREPMEPLLPLDQIGEREPRGGDVAENR